MEYTVVEEQSLEKLIDAVNALIRQGWKPQGGISFVLGSVWYKQAMVR